MIQALEELSVVDATDSDISSIDELIDLNIPITHLVNNEADNSHQENIIEPIEGDNEAILNNDACAHSHEVEVEDVTITLPRRIEHSLREEV